MSSSRVMKNVLFSQKKISIYIPFLSTHNYISLRWLKGRMRFGKKNHDVFELRQYLIILRLTRRHGVGVGGSVAGGLRRRRGRSLDRGRGGGARTVVGEAARCVGRLLWCPELKITN